MHVHEAIQRRRSIFDFKPEPVPDTLVERLLGFGIWAPNHHLTEPWRFTHLGEEMRHLLAERYGEIQIRKAREDVSDAVREQIRAAGIAKFLSKPTIVVVSCVQEGDEQRRREDYAAVCCAVQNVMLAAWAEGVGVQWSTNALIQERETYARLGIDPEREEIIGFLYMGYPAEVLPTRGRRPIRDVLRRTP
jgi:nitroreductase